MHWILILYQTRNPPKSLIVDIELTVCMKASAEASFDHITQKVETNFPRK